MDELIENHVDGIISELKDCNELTPNLEEILNSKKKPFEKFRSTHLQLKLFSNVGTYIPPRQIKLGEREEFRKKKNEKRRVTLDVTAEFIPMRKVLQMFFQLPDVLDKTVEYIESLECERNLITNFIQTDFWRKELLNCGSKFYLPLFLYCDDYATNNPLGTHATLAKCGGVYLSIPCLPSEMRSKLENIFVFALLNTLDRKLFKNKTFFREIITELNFLDQQGILVRRKNSENFRIHFRFVNFLGDNLGMHEILGFSQCFRSRHPCRMCLIPYDDINKVYSEDDVVLRNAENYDADVKQNGHNVTEECVKIPFIVFIKT
jgi:hypothetical protein